MKPSKKQVPPPPSSSPVEDEDSLQPGTIVLTKCPTFPWWPAMIFAESLVPHIIKDKPVKKKTWPVKFFSDNQFHWADVNELRLLSLDQAREELRNMRSKVNKHGRKYSPPKSLFNAYEYAVGEPTLSDVYQEAFGESLPAKYNKDDELMEMNSRVKLHLQAKKSRKVSAASSDVADSPQSDSSSVSRTSSSVPGTTRGRAIMKKKKVVTVRRGLLQTAPIVPSRAQCERELEVRKYTAMSAAKTLLSKVRPGAELSDKDVDACHSAMDLLMVIADLEPDILKQANLKRTMESIQKLAAHNVIVRESGLEHTAGLLLKLWSSVPGKETVI